MKILILGNMANDGYSMAKGLREKNITVDLAINISENVLALPQWEDANLDQFSDPYSLNKNKIKESWKSPSWVHYFDFKNNFSSFHIFQKIKARIDLIKMIREYDVVEAHVPYSIYTQFTGVPYVSYDAGWIRYFPFKNGIRDKLARRAYTKAKKIIFTNPDTFEIFDKLNYLDSKKIHFVPFAIDPSKYRPFDARDFRRKYVADNELLIFSPTRHAWHNQGKGNDKIIKGFAKFQKDFPNSKLLMMKWGIDIQKSENLVKELNITKNVIWLKLVPKNQLIKFYNAADIVMDQFVVGSWGTTTPEAMACQKPIIMFYNEDYILRAFGEKPPILNSFTDNEIHLNLKKLTNDDFRRELGIQSRDWIIKTHSPEKVASIHLEILEAALK